MIIRSVSATNTKPKLVYSIASSHASFKANAIKKRKLRGALSAQVGLKVIFDPFNGNISRMLVNKESHNKGIRILSSTVK